MKKYVLKRLLYILVVFLVIALIMYWLFNLIPTIAGLISKTALPAVSRLTAVDDRDHTSPYIRAVLTCALYITADLGVSTYDAISLHMADRKLGPYRLLRIGTDLMCVVAGFLMGATVGVCTVVTAFLLGPAIAFLREKCFEPLLHAGGSAEPLTTK